MWRHQLALVLLVAVVFAADEDTVMKPDVHKFQIPSPPPGEQFFYETFTDRENFETRWIQSKATKDGADSDIAKYDGDWVLEAPTHVGALDGETGLVMKTEAKHYAISAKLDKPFVFSSSDNEGFVIQYEVNFQETLACGGAYVKLLSVSDDLGEFNDQTPYSIMFGPDKCGQTSKIHFIVRFKHPVTGEIEEKHCKQPTSGLDFFNDKRTHMFTLNIRADGHYAIVVDTVSIQTGTLQDDFTPSFIPPKEVDDPEDKKPEDWDDREEIPEPGATKPDDWDEEAPLKISDPNAEKPAGWLDEAAEMVPDPEAEKPTDWDEDEDGDWEAPMIANPVCVEIGCGEWTAPLIKNPAYKGKWRSPVIKNPNYSGVWAPKKIANPDYFEETDIFPLLTPIGALGLELWTMSKGLIFDNFIVTNEMTAASSFSLEGWTKKYESEQEANGVAKQLGPWVNYFIDIANTYPYLWALYAIGLVMPFVLCAACCVRTKSSKPTEDEAAKRKKTDAPTPDDPSTADKKEEKSTSKKRSEEENKSFVASEDDDTGEASETKEGEEDEEVTRGSGAEGGDKDGDGEVEEEEEEVGEGVDKKEEVEEDKEQKPRKRGGKKKTRRED